MDEMVTSAVAHWGPRFTVNGVITAVSERVTAGIERWSDCVAGNRVPPLLNRLRPA